MSILYTLEIKAVAYFKYILTIFFYNRKQKNTEQLFVLIGFCFIGHYQKEMSYIKKNDQYHYVDYVIAYVTRGFSPYLFGYYITGRVTQIKNYHLWQTNISTLATKSTFKN